MSSALLWATATGHVHLPVSVSSERSISSTAFYVSHLWEPCNFLLAYLTRNFEVATSATLVAMRAHTLRVELLRSQLQFGKGVRLAE
eukprot:4033046-Amphidinium_carterae.1